MIIRASILSLFALCTVLSASVWAQAPALPKPPMAPLGSDLVPAPRWEDLNPSEQSALAPLSTRFNLLDNAQRRKWKVVANHFPQFTPEKQRLTQSRMLAWASMTAEQRAAARQQALASRSTGKIGQQRAQDWELWQSMENGERESLHQKAVRHVPSTQAHP